MISYNGGASSASLLVLRGSMDVRSASQNSGPPWLRCLSHSSSFGLRHLFGYVRFQPCYQRSPNKFSTRQRFAITDSASEAIESRIALMFDALTLQLFNASTTPF